MTSNVKISNVGLYHTKSSKLYGKRIIDVDKNTGDYILSDWGNTGSNVCGWSIYTYLKYYSQ